MRNGEMLEWLKRHAWKACKLQKGFRGSNPRLSAKDFCYEPGRKFTFGYGRSKSLAQDASGRLWIIRSETT